MRHKHDRREDRAASFTDSAATSSSFITTLLRTAWLAIALISLVTGCDDPMGVIADGSPDDQERMAARLVRLYVSLQEENGWSAENAESWSAEKLGGRIYLECVWKLQNPQGIGASQRYPFDSCPSLNPTESGYWPANALTCEAAVCEAEAALCVSNRLFDIAHSVGESNVDRVDAAILAVSASRSLPAIPERLRIPPQSARTNSRIMEVAVGWAQRAGTRAGENLRSALGRYEVYRGTQRLNMSANSSDLSGVCQVLRPHVDASPRRDCIPSV